VHRNAPRQAVRDLKAAQLQSDAACGLTERTTNTRSHEEAFESQAVLRAFAASRFQNLFYRNEEAQPFELTGLSREE
jgi:hypothetical protein